MFRLGRRSPSNRGERQDRIPLTLYGERILLRPTQSSDVEALHRILKIQEVQQRWGSYETADEVEEDFIERADATLGFTMELDGEVIGGLQLWQELDPEYRHAGFDIFIDPKFHGRGIGVEAIRLVTRYAFDVLGHHRVTIDPAADNAQGIRAYEKAGFKTIGVMHNYERGVDGTWHDNILMECTREDLYGVKK